MDSYPRTCPYCDASFRAVTDCGTCPYCNEFSRIDRHGNFVVLIDAKPLDELSNGNPFRNTPLPVVFQWIDSGGGPITRSAQYAGKPSIAEIHRQLSTRFKWLVSLLDEYGLDPQTEEVAQPATHPDWSPTRFANAEKLLVAFWLIDNHRYAVACSLTDSGGEIHAIPPNAEYHLHSE